MSPGRAGDAPAAQCDTVDDVKKATAPANQPKPVRVVQICVNAEKRRASPPTMYVEPPGGPANDQATLLVDEVFDSGTIVGAPANIFVDFATSNGNFIRAQNGFRARIIAADSATTIASPAPSSTST